jgi:hypothetical protein
VELEVLSSSLRAGTNKNPRTDRWPLWRTRPDAVSPPVGSRSRGAAPAVAASKACDPPRQSWFSASVAQFGVRTSSNGKSWFSASAARFGVRTSSDVKNASASLHRHERHALKRDPYPLAPPPSCRRRSAPTTSIGIAVGPGHRAESARRTMPGCRQWRKVITATLRANECLARRSALRSKRRQGSPTDVFKVSAKRFCAAQKTI